VLPPAVLRPGGSVEVLWLLAGPPIGTGVGGYQSLTVRMDCGATLLLYDDVAILAARRRAESE
jgi:hypothetical protein